MATLAFRTQLTQARVIVLGQVLEFFHGARHLGRFHRSRSGEARVGMQKACKCHAGKRLVAQGVFVGVLRLRQSHLGTETFRLADLPARLKLLGTFQMLFKVPHRGFAHPGKFLGQAERKVLGRHVHQNCILRHVEFGLARIHIFLSGIVRRSNLESRKDGPDGGEAGVEENVVLHLHAKIGIVDFIGILLFRSIRILYGGIPRILTRHNAVPNFGRPRIHIGLGGIFAHARGSRLRNGILVRLGIGTVIGGDIRLGVGGSPRDIGHRLL